MARAQNIPVRFSGTMREYAEIAKGQLRDSLDIFGEKLTQWRAMIFALRISVFAHRPER